MSSKHAEKSNVDNDGCTALMRASLRHIRLSTEPPEQKSELEQLLLLEEKLLEQLKNSKGIPDDELKKRQLCYQVANLTAQKVIEEKDGLYNMSRSTSRRRTEMLEQLNDVVTKNEGFWWPSWDIGLTSLLRAMERLCLRARKWA